jgi:hypothetical protein
MFSSLRRRLETTRFDFAIRGILRAPPARLGDAPVHVVSMVRTEHLRMYLLSIKSFLAQVPARAVTVLDDGSLTQADQALLRAQVPGLAITPLASIDTGPCPRGGCWERLLHILDLSAHDYVVQLDSDILTARPIPEVVEAIAQNRSFTLGSGAEFQRITTAQARRNMTGQDMTVTQVAAEHALGDVPAAIGGHYVRGSAGFAGFARGAVPRAQAEAFSAAMQAQMGARWAAWGTEQVASNFLIANAPGGDVLPWPRYICHYARDDDENAALLHFLGSWRFERGTYARLGRRVVGELLAATPAAA